MSLRALSERAAWRDSDSPGVATRAVEGGLPATGAAELTKAEGALTAAIPTEVLGP